MGSAGGCELKDMQVDKGHSIQLKEVTFIGGFSLCG
jgi:hypothetical protein